MKTNRLILAVVTLVMAAEAGLGTARGATNDVSGLLQKGLFEEEANHNLEAAIQAYAGVVTQTEKNRQFAATAVFRLGECYRKQGKTNEANAQYQKILRDFSDQVEFAKLSRQQLGTTPDPAQGGSVNEDELAALKKLSPEKRRVAVQQMFPNPVLNSLLQKMTETEQWLAEAKSKYGDQHPEVTAKMAVLKSIDQQIDDQVEGVLAGRGKPTGAVRMDLEPDIRPMEANEVKQIQAMIKESPDLINVPDGGSTPLYTAVAANHPVVVRFLLDNKADIEARGTQPWTPLLAAAEKGNREMVELLLGRGANVKAVAQYPSDPGFRENGSTPLHYAVIRGYKAVAEALLTHGAAVDARTVEGKTPLHMAASKGFKTVVELLISHGAEVDARRGTGATPLMEAAYSGNTAIVELLLTNKADVNAADTDGATALYMAADTGRPAIAELLITHGAELNRITAQGMTALMEAIALKRVDVAEVLLAHGADTKIQQSGKGDGSGGWGALHFAVDKNFPELVKALLEKSAGVNAVARFSARVNPGNEISSTYHNFTPLMIAVYNGKTELAKILLAHQADVNFQNENHETPLFVAVMRNSSEMTGLLLESKADVKPLDYKGWSLLHHAVSDRHQDIVELLLAHGADPKVRLSAPDQSNISGWTALHLASANHLTNMAALLLSAGADINGQSANGETPLILAVRYPGNPTAATKTMIEFLLEHGADVNRLDNNGRAVLDLLDANKNKEIVELLRQHGAVSVLERGTIRIMRRGQTAPAIVFRKDAKGYNHHTLFEVLGFTYPHPLGLGYVSPTTGGNRQPELPGFYFPDFAKIKIYQVEHGTLGPDHTNTLNVDMQTALNAGDCSVNWPLNWGDIVELPELDHNVSEAWGGLLEPELNTFKKCLERHIRIIVKGKETQLTLAPNPSADRGSQRLDRFNPVTPVRTAPITELSIFWLGDMLRSASVILASSDTTKVKVKRLDSKTNKTAEMVFNLDKIDAYSDLWLQDGDVIEIPEKGAE